jgi:hypothetical protein
VRKSRVNCSEGESYQSRTSSNCDFALSLVRSHSEACDLRGHIGSFRQGDSQVRSLANVRRELARRHECSDFSNTTFGKGNTEQIPHDLSSHDISLMPARVAQRSRSPNSHIFSKPLRGKQESIHQAQPLTKVKPTIASTPYSLVIGRGIEASALRRSSRQPPIPMTSLFTFSLGNK